MRRLNLFHKFLLILFLSTALGIVTLASALSYFVTKNVIDEEAMDTASLVRMLSEASLSAELFNNAVREHDRSTFTRFASQLISMPEMIRIKIFDSEGTVVWSDEDRLIGKNFDGNLELAEALRGTVQVTLGRIKNEHIYEREKYNEERLLEVYVPLVVSGSDDVYGVLEIYKYPVSHFSLLDRMNGAVWVTSLTLGIFWFASCSWLFKKALKDQERLDQEKCLTETRLIQAEKLATAGEMLAGLAHEINNPLNIIMTKVQMILKNLQITSKGIEWVEELRIVDKNIVRIGGIIRNILAFSKKSKCEMVPMDLNAVVKESLALVEQPFAKLNIVCMCDLDSSLPAILGDANQLQQVFLNLFTNARDAIHNGGNIWVRTFSVNHEGLWAFAEIRDSGAGIPPEIVGRIFDPFFTTKESCEKAGLGLSVSYGIVKSHKGAIQVESQPGQGSAFTLKFPVRA